MSIAKQIPDHIKRVSRSVGYALWLDHTDDWFGLPVIFRARLDARQRAALAFMALKSLDYDDALLTAETALDESAGMPMVPLFGYMDQAVFWADMAAPDELDAYVLAIFKRMAPARQSAFLDYLLGRAAA